MGPRACAILLTQTAWRSVGGFRDRAEAPRAPRGVGEWPGRGSHARPINNAMGDIFPHEAAFRVCALVSQT